MNKLKIKLRFRVNPFLFIRNRKVAYEECGEYYNVYELYKSVLPFVYVYTGTWTYLKQGSPANYAKLHRIIEKYKEKGYV